VALSKNCQVVVKNCTLVAMISVLLVRRYSPLSTAYFFPFAE